MPEVISRQQLTCHGMENGLRFRRLRATDVRVRSSDLNFTMPPEPSSTGPTRLQQKGELREKRHRDSDVAVRISGRSDVGTRVGVRVLKTCRRDLSHRRERVRVRKTRPVTSKAFGVSRLTWAHVRSYLAVIGPA